MLRPVININGKSREMHVSERLAVISALRDALEAMLEIRPHGRDYLGNDERLKEDVAYHNHRFNTLYSLKTEIETEALLIKNGDQS